MLITRWQAPHLPTSQQIRAMLESEGLQPFEETLESNASIADHRHAFDEVRIVLSGSLLMNIAGNQLLLRPGDRIEIASNTRHSKKNEATEPCVCVVAQRTF